MAQDGLLIDLKSGFCASNSTFYSKRDPMAFPSNESLDITTFLYSHPHHGHIAYIDADTGRYLTFTQVWQAVDSVSASLSNLGIRRGDVILILSPNSIFFPIVCHSVLSLGAIITTANPINTPTEITAQLADSKPILAFTTQSLLSKLSTTNLPIILIDGKLDENSVKYATLVSTLDEMMKTEPSPIQYKARVNLDDTASLLYSSGTTGKSKGVITTHRNFIAVVQNVLTLVRTEKQKQIAIATVPMFHMYGISWFAMALLASGWTVVVLSRFDKDAMLSAVERFSVTYLVVAPPVLVTMINDADVIKRRWRLSSLRRVICGGAPLSREVIEGFLDKYPMVKIFQGYGLTESTGLGATARSMEESKRYGSVGLIAPSLEAKIVDTKSGEPMGVNRTGELWVRGPSIMKGYLNNSEATASTLDSNGWLKTGDLCYIDDDGFLFIVDRVKELIKYKGYQVAPAELEALLLTHPQIVDAAVIPFPDKDAGQIPMAYVVRKVNSELSKTTVMDFVARQVAPYKRIRRVEFIDAIPKNPSGKILRKELVKLVTSRI